MQTMTVGKPARLLVRFTWPLVVGRLAQILYGYMDMLIVGRKLGMNALAGVGSTTSIIHLVVGFCMGSANAVGILVAQRYGAEDNEGMRRYFGIGVTVCLLMGGLVALMMAPMSRLILLWLNTPPEIMDDARRYMCVMLCATPLSMLSVLLPSVLRAVGNSKSAVVYQMFSTVLKTVAGPLFVLVFGWGVTGAALSTILADACVPLLCAVLIRRRYEQLHLSPAYLRPDARRFGEILSLGIPMGLQQSIVEVGNLLVQSVINGLGAVAVAAVTAAQRIRALNMVPLFSLGTAVLTYTAQNYGAMHIARVRDGIRAACTIAAGCGVGMAIFNILAGNWLSGLLLPDAPEAVALSYQYLVWGGCCLFLLGIMLVFRNALQGMGRKNAPTLSSIAELIASVVCAGFLVPVFGFLGVSLANPLAWLLSGIPLLIACARWMARLADGRTV
ncbi:MAG: MATE family efflux transporter [Clostridia bacterium]|nr:MATE family efflux transporter [Clostridia bacterium]